MKELHWYLILFMIWCGVSDCYKYDIRYITQKVDHFSYVNEKTFQQRYLINEDYFNAVNGSVFFYAGNEGDIEMFANNTGFMWEHAKEFNALILFAEHRYYGKSMPYGKWSYKVNKYLGYLTSEQALADFAYLINELKVNFKGINEVPIIVFGGSYGGMLAAWMRMKYPHLVNGAYASSAPVLMFPGLSPCGAFSEIVTKSFRKCSTVCEKVIRKSWGMIRHFGSTDIGSKFLTETFNLCLPLKNSSDIDKFIDWLSETWETLAMINYPYPTNFLIPLPANPVKAACDQLEKEIVNDTQLITRIFEAASVFHNYTGDAPCFNLSSSDEKDLGTEGWDYQSCTEMLYPTCKNGTTDMFEPELWNFTAFSQQCWKKWRITPEKYKALYMYGGRNIKASSNIIFSNGDLDPWSALGILKSLSSSLKAIYIKDAAHHLDLRSSNPADPPSVIEARKTILSIISMWIKDAQKSA